METLLDKTEFAYPSVTCNLKRGAKQLKDNEKSWNQTYQKDVLWTVYFNEIEFFPVFGISKNVLSGMHC